LEDISKETKGGGRGKGKKGVVDRPPVFEVSNNKKGAEEKARDKGKNTWGSGGRGK